jgi:hypothetical protein
VGKTITFSDGSRQHVVKVTDPEATAEGDYALTVTTGDDTEAHFLSVAAASQGYLRVASRDGRAYRVEVRDADQGKLFRAVQEGEEDVSGHALDEAVWDISGELDDDVAGHGLKEVKPGLYVAAATVAMLLASAQPAMAGWCKSC